MCKLEKSTEKSKNVSKEHQEMEKVSTRLVGVVKEVVFLLKCVIVHVVFIWTCSPSEELVKYV